MKSSTIKKRTAVKTDHAGPEALLNLALKAMTALDHLSVAQILSIESQGPQLIRELNQGDTLSQRAVHAFSRYCEQNPSMRSRQDHWRLST
jgi:hypothetical protein